MFLVEQCENTCHTDVQMVPNSDSKNCFTISVHAYGACHIPGHI